MKVSNIVKRFSVCRLPEIVRITRLFHSIQLKAINTQNCINRNLQDSAAHQHFRVSGLLILPLWRQWFTLRVAGFKVKQLYSFAHKSACVVYVAVRTMFSFLYSSNCLLFVLETGHVFCTVRNESWI